MEISLPEPLLQEPMIIESGHSNVHVGLEILEWVFLMSIILGIHLAISPQQGQAK